MPRTLSNRGRVSDKAYRVVVTRLFQDGSERTEIFGLYATKGGANAMRTYQRRRHGWDRQPGVTLDAYVESTPVEWTREDS
jgi:hypothetical protein